MQEERHHDKEATTWILMLDLRLWKTATLGDPKMIITIEGLNLSATEINYNTSCDQR